MAGGSETSSPILSKTRNYVRGPAYPVRSSILKVGTIRHRGLSGRTPKVRQSVCLFFFLPAGLRVAQPCRYCFYSLAQKWVFRPAGATRCPDKRESWHCGPIPSANFHVYRGKNVGIQPPKLSKFRILARHLYLRGDSFAIFLRHSQRLYVYR